ncbi:hypothetical protein G7009_19090 [Pseudomonas capeferrum]|uniref:hypothetical protein n=1 Tax=Pseudomonas capeferrum TaxID=1495066 RepID=UPI0015E420FC|nr:hypothetical protein [Pseudomonas capeferrum]MBA1203830.1 hypothetical protein [Pseudomonas capeferrum]
MGAAIFPVFQAATACVLHDDAEGTPRLTYALIENGIVKATAVYVNVDPINGVPCFGLG